MKTILVVDPAPSKRDYIIEGLKKLGIRTIGLTPINSCSGFVLCDYKIVRDFSDVTNIMQDLEKMPKVDGVICFHQAAITFANKLCYELNLPMIWADKELDLANKISVNKKWEEAGLRVPKSYVYEKLTCEKLEFPVVVKPANLQGSIGVKECSSMEEVLEWGEFIKDIRLPFEVDGKMWDMVDLYHSDRTPFIQEKIVSSSPWEYENSVEMIVQNGSVKIINFIDKNCIKNEKYFLESLFIYPAISNISQFSDDLIKYVSALNIQNSIVHLEFKVDDKGVVPIELNCRVIGEPMARLLYNFESLDLSKVLYQVATKESVNLNKLSDDQKWCGFSFVHPSSLMMNSYKVFNGVKFKAFKGVEVQFFAGFKTGEKIIYDKAMHSLPLGYFQFQSENRDDIIYFKNNFLDTITFE